MRSVLRMSILAVGFLVFVGTTSLAASDTLEVKIPFGFVVNGLNLPAGLYRVERIDTLPSVLLIRGEKGNHDAAFVLTSPAGGHDPAGAAPVLTFRRYEDQYRLSSVWQSGTEGWSVVGK
jgi:hypothetical protein